MLERMQIQAIAQVLAGNDPGIDASALDQPWRHVYDELKDMGLILGMGPEPALYYTLRGHDDAHAIAQRILGVLVQIPDRAYPHLASLAAQLPPIRWLWPGWIPRGMLSLLGASPGAGKSLVALDLARRIIHDASFPDGSPIPRPGSPVIYVDAEAIPQIQNQRAVAWNMDRERIYLMLPPDTYGMIDFGDIEHQNRLIDMCATLEPDLIVVDSLSSISVKGENNVEDVRSILGFLSAVAREFDAGLLLVHHLRKRSKTPLMDLVTADDFRGSSHIIAMARSVLALSIIQETPEPDRNGPRRMEIIKTNLCEYPKPLGCRFQPGEGAPTLLYTDPPKPYREPSTTEECEAWLVDLLEEGPLKPKEIIDLADDYGFKEGTLRNARCNLEGIVVDTEESNHSPYNKWALAEDNDDPAT